MVPWNRACATVGIKTGIHIARHTFASEWAMRGGSLYDLCKVCGWQNFKMIEERYAHLSPEYLQESITIMSGAAG